MASLGSKRGASSQGNKDTGIESFDDNDRPQRATDQVMKTRKILDPRRRRQGFGHRAGPGVESLGNIFAPQNQTPQLNGDSSSTLFGQNQSSQSNPFAQSSQSFPPPSQPSFNPSTSTNSSFPPSQSNGGFVFGGSLSQQPSTGFDFGVNNSAPNPFSQGQQPTNTAQTGPFFSMGTDSGSMPSKFLGLGQNNNQVNGAVNGSLNHQSTSPEGMQISPPVTPDKKGLNNTSSTLFSSNKPAFSFGASPSKPATQTPASSILGTAVNGQTGKGGLFGSPAFKFGQTPNLAEQTPGESSITQKPATDTTQSPSFSFGQTPKPSSTVQNTTANQPATTAEPKAMFGGVLTPKPNGQNQEPMSTNPFAHIQTNTPKQDGFLTPAQNSVAKATIPASNPPSLFSSSQMSQANPSKNATFASAPSDSIDLGKDRSSQVDNESIDQIMKLKALNAGFQRALTKLDSNQDWTEMMQAYFAHREVLLSTSSPEQSNKRKAEDKLPEGEARARNGKSSSFGAFTASQAPQSGHSPSKTANIFQSIVDSPAKGSSNSPNLGRNLFSPSSTSTQPSIAPSFMNTNTSQNVSTPLEPNPFASISTSARPEALMKSSTSFKQDPLTSKGQDFSQTPFASHKLPSASAGPALSGPKIPTFSQPTGGSFMSAFGQQAKKAEEEAKAKRKAEDFDSDEDNEEEWERRDAEEQKQKRAKLAEGAANSPTFSFQPGKAVSFGGSRAQSEDAESTTSQQPNSIFATGNGTPARTSQSPAPGNIFGHLSQPPQDTSGTKDSDPDSDADEPSNEVTQTSASRDGVAVDTAVEPISKPVKSLFERVTNTPNMTSQGDHTWKQDSPIKFGDQNNTTQSDTSTPRLGATLFPSTSSSPFKNPASNTSPFKSTPSSGLFGSTTPFAGKPNDITTATPSLFSKSTKSSSSNSTSEGLTGGSNGTIIPSNASDSPTKEPSDDLPGPVEVVDPAEDLSNEDILFEAKNASIMKYNNPKNSASASASASDSEASTNGTSTHSKPYSSRGKGILRVLRNRDTNVTRVLCRSADKVARLQFNSRLLSGANYGKVAGSAKHVQIPVVKSGGRELETWVVTLDPERAKDLVDVLETEKIRND